MADLQHLLERTALLHDHLCPRQVLGVRMGMYAAEIFGLEIPQSDKRLFAFVETDGCFTDGISVASGCSLGHRTLRLMDYGKVAATFIDTGNERAVRIWPHPASRQRAIGCVPDAQSNWHAQLKAYQVMPLNDLFRVASVSLNLSMQVLISRPGVRETCAVCGEEILNERQVILNNKVLCQSCADGGYYQIVESGTMVHGR